MGMNVYIKLEDLVANTKYLEHFIMHGEVSKVSYSMDEEGLSIDVTIRKDGVVVHGDLHFGGDNLVMFGRSAEQQIIKICTQVGIPFSFF